MESLCFSLSLTHSFSLPLPVFILIAGVESGALESATSFQSSSLCCTSNTRLLPQQIIDLTHYHSRRWRLHSIASHPDIHPFDFHVPWLEYTVCNMSPNTLSGMAPFSVFSLLLTSLVSQSGTRIGYSLSSSSYVKLLQDLELNQDCTALRLHQDAETAHLFLLLPACFSLLVITVTLHKLYKV